MPGAEPLGPPLRAELFVVAAPEESLLLLEWDGVAPCRFAVVAGEHPLRQVSRRAREMGLEPLLLHSTSWRYEAGGVILTFLAAAEPPVDRLVETSPVRRARLARSRATSAPLHIGSEQVLEHALRHFAWLVDADPNARRALPGNWHQALAGYEREPFLDVGHRAQTARSFARAAVASASD